MTGRVLVAVALLALGAVSVPALASVSAGRRAPAVTINPSTGSPTSRFAVRFVAPARTGSYGGFVHRLSMSVTATSKRGRCLAGAADEVVVGRAPARVTVTISPGTGHRWCLGTFRGQIDELRTPVCPPRELCPAFVVVSPIGRFSFRVTARG